MKLAIYGYGNLGKGIECAVRQNTDMTLTGIYTRRNPDTVHSLTGIPVYSAQHIFEHKNEIDAVIVCGGSATDLPVLTPALAKEFNTVDSFDTHAGIPAHFDAVDTAATQSGHIALISTGWDPGLFSLQRLYASAVLPDGQDYTFWGKGISQGHSDAVRRIDGVLDARQYTVPIEEALEKVRSGENPVLTPRQKHRRECFVVAREGADRNEIEQKIKTMPHYFDEYDTDVHFITQEELNRNHTGLPHGGFVIRTGHTGLRNEHTQSMEYSLHLDSNPEFTASVLLAFTRAILKMRTRGQTGCKTVFDIAPADLSPLTGEQLRKTML